jgi:hypothetical protein
MTTIKQELVIPLLPRFSLFIFVGFMLYIKLIYPHDIDFAFWFALKVLFFLFLSFILFTTGYRLDLDYQKKSYYRYLWILGFKIGSRGKFNSIERIFINEIRYGNTVRSGILPQVAKSIMFFNKSYIKFDNGEKMVLLEMHNKEKLIAKLKNLNKKLKTKIYDSTSGISVLIDE